ncbi:MAG: hypothetical protein ACRC62_10840 [Microcoleus sp.]
MNYEFSHRLIYGKLQVDEVHARKLVSGRNPVSLCLTYLKSLVGVKSLSISAPV